MSYVTDVIIVTDCGDDQEVLKDLNQWARDSDYRQEFHQIDEHGGGCKAHQLDIISAAWNYLHLQKFMRFLVSKLDEPHESQFDPWGGWIILIVQREHDYDGPTVYYGKEAIKNGLQRMVEEDGYNDE